MRNGWVYWRVPHIETFSDRGSCVLNNQALVITSVLSLIAASGLLLAIAVRIFESAMDHMLRNPHHRSPRGGTPGNQRTLICSSVPGLLRTSYQCLSAMLSNVSSSPNSC